MRPSPRLAIGREVDLQASPERLLSHIAARWDIEVLFGDGKEELGLDQYQLMSATAIVRFWTLALLAYVFLEEECTRLQAQWHRHVTIGERGAKYSVGIVERSSLGFMSSSNQVSN